ncbi:MAG TPA: prolyl oligopeptidase family serine peptidase [Thermoanaerobaculia bacterium]|jgi:predicted peptidase
MFVPRKIASGTFQLYLPPDLPSSPPVVLFLHGAGEGGLDGFLQTTVGLGPAMLKDPTRFPLVGVFPQSPPRIPWRGQSIEHAVRALEATLDELRCDRDRVYLTGISMGGYGTWHLATAQPARFAAIVPICGGSASPELTAERLADVPAWVFHGDRDNIIPVEESRDVVAALRARGSNVRYTEYRNVRHNSWDPAYAEPELMPWLLAQRRTPPPPPRSSY